MGVRLNRRRAGESAIQSTLAALTHPLISAGMVACGVTVKLAKKRPVELRAVGGSGRGGVPSTSHHHVSVSDNVCVNIPAV